MSAKALSEEMDVVLAAACERLGVPTTSANLLHFHSNAAFALPEHGLLVRIAGSPTAFDRVAGSVTVTRWLADRQYPTVRPADIPDQPWRINDRAVSVWKLEDVADGQDASGEDLGRLLRDLHDQPLPPFPVRRLTDPLASVAEAVDNAPDLVPSGDRVWLRDRVEELRQVWDAMDFPRPVALVHGDAHPNNVMRLSSGRLLLADWDHVAVGPPEWDLIQVLYTRRRFHRPESEEIAALTQAYGWDVAEWPGADDLIAIRELSGLSPYIRNAETAGVDELVRRVRSLREGDQSEVWETPSDG